MTRPAAPGPAAPRPGASWPAADQAIGRYLAQQQGATVIAFTDPYLSPAAAHADMILTASLQSSSAFGAMTPSLALVEAIITAVVAQMGDAPRARMARYDQLHEGTVDGSDPAGRAEWPAAAP